MSEVEDEEEDLGDRERQGRTEDEARTGDSSWLYTNTHSFCLLH